MSENKNAKCKILTIFHHPHHRRFSMAELLQAGNLRSVLDQPGEGEGGVGMWAFGVVV